MNASVFDELSHSASGSGPLYIRLGRTIEAAIDSGQLGPGDTLPPEREIAGRTGLSRVTVRKAVQSLVRTGRLVQRRGSGTFVAPSVERLELALSRLTSFSEDMARRGRAVRTVWISRIIRPATPDEMMALGLTAEDLVASLERVRHADGVPLAIERAVLPTAILPDPAAVETSLYTVLAARGLRPVRTVQRLSATNLAEADAELLAVAQGAAGLRIERISYLASGRVVEFTRSLYRGDAYDFAAELRLADDPEGES
jgi:GntR family transcriptional regulator